MRTFFLLLVLAILFPSAAFAAVAAPNLRACLAKADDLPDMALAEADNWYKHGGGEGALICRATAQFHIGSFADAGKGFLTVAASQKDPRQASLLYRQAGLAYSRAGDFNDAEQAYGRALVYEGQDPDLWVDRAQARASAQHYWEAIDDLNRALTIMPDMPEALRMRGQVWYKLGYDKNAEKDFSDVAEIQAEDDVVAARNHPKTAK